MSAKMTAEERARRAERERDDLRTVLRSLISTGGMSSISQAIAMNALEPGSGDAWLDARSIVRRVPPISDGGKP